jgi:hypothetical protein
MDTKKSKKSLLINLKPVFQYGLGLYRTYLKSTPDPLNWQVFEVILTESPEMLALQVLQEIFQTDSIEKMGIGHSILNVMNSMN